jgi:hypothetical protein
MGSQLEQLMGLFFDAWLAAPPLPLAGPMLPEGCAGAMLSGLDAKARCQELERWRPQLLWRYAELLERIVGETHARFPSRSATVIDLLLDDDYLDLCLKRPAEWWPLCYPLRNTARWIRLALPAGAPVLARVKQILKRYPETLFWVDPFRYGPQPGWQGHVRLAEWPNVVLTTFGLFPGFSAWTSEQAEEALTFVVGEVGAAKLLYATGGAWDDLVSGRDRGARAWLESRTRLDAQEREMVLCGNALQLFGPPPAGE